MDLEIKKIIDKIDLDVESNSGFCSGSTKCETVTHVDGPGIPGDGAIYICGTFVSSYSPNESQWHWW